MANAKNSSLSNVQPTAGYVFIEPEEQKKQTSSGIYLPENTSGDKPQTGKIIAVGPAEVTDKGSKRESPAKKGDLVIYKKWGGNEVKIDNKEYLFVKFEDILAVLN
jgi:chaperonin GroES